jgi:hypothetical protein
VSIEALNYARRVKVGNTTAKFVLTRLADRADERYSCFPSVGLLAAECETSPRTVQRSLNSLRELRLMSDRAQYRPDGSQTTSRYVLHGPWDNYAGTGVPFPEIITPRQARRELWAQAPAEGGFREGTAAAVALTGDLAEAEAAAQRAAEAAGRATAAKESKRARGRKAAAAKRREAAPAAEACEDAPAGGGGVTPMSPPPVTSASPLPVPPVSPLESTSTTHIGKEKTEGSAVGQTAGGFVRARASSGAPPIADSTTGGSAADLKNSPSIPKRSMPKPTKVTPARLVAGEEDVWLALAPALAGTGTRAGARPPTLRKAVRMLLGHDTDARSSAFRLYPRRSEHALARINRGWYRARCPERAARGYEGPDAIRRPVGYLVEILTSQECIRPECELGVLLTTGKECTQCEGRAAERAGAALAARLKTETAALAASPREDAGADERRVYGNQLSLPRQRVTWRCEGPGCGRVGRCAPPDVPLCSECQEDIEMALHTAARQGPAHGHARPLRR